MKLNKPHSGWMVSRPKFEMVHLWLQVKNVIPVINFLHASESYMTRVIRQIM